MKIIGISGTNGSGKDTAAKLLVSQYGFMWGDATTLLTEELVKRGLPTDRPHKAQLSAEWRRHHGMAAIVNKAIEMYRQQGGDEKYAGLVVGSLRHPGEAEAVHEQGGTVVWIDGDPRLRYERIQAHAAERGRALEDDKTFEDFMADEEREMHPSGDAATLDMAAVKEHADVTIMNEGDIVSFKKQIVQTLGL